MKPNTEKFLENLIEIDPRYPEEVKGLESDFKCEITHSIEKHHELQLTYYYDVVFEGVDSVYYVEIESGINNGTVIQHAEWDSSTYSTSKMEWILKGVEFSEAKFNAWCQRKCIPLSKRGFVKRKAKALLESSKDELMNLHRSEAYDNYVTGGGTIKTKEHYKSKYNDLEENGVFFEYVHEWMEVDRRFV